MDIHEIMQTLGQYAYLALTAVKAGIKHAWTAVSTWFHALPFPTSIKLFGNDTVNKYLFFGIWAFYLFGHDKSRAKRRDRRISEKKLFRVCFWGGAIGGLIGMNAFHHKTLKKKFSVGVPILFVLQLIADSFVLGFLGFWTFF